MILGNAAGAGGTPGTPTGVTATAGNTQATVSFTAPTYLGKSGSVTYVVTASPGGATASGSASPITVTGLTNGTSYTFTVYALTPYGVSGGASSASNAVTPAVPAPPPPPPPPPCSCAPQPWPQNCGFVGYTCDGQMRYDYYDCGCSQTCPGTGGYNGQFVVGYCGYTGSAPPPPPPTDGCAACGGGGGPTGFCVYDFGTPFCIIL